jgi:hypothetical protein
MAIIMAEAPAANRHSAGSLAGMQKTGFASGRQTVLALLFFAVTSGLMLAPLLASLSTALPGGGDVYEYVWKLWWFKQSLLLGQSPWLVPDVYYPFGFPLAFGESTTANTIPALPLTLLLGEITTYNVLVFFGRVMAGFTMYLLAKEVTGNFGAGLLAGTIFAFAPFNRVHLVHLPLTTTFWLPLVFLFLERFIRSNRPVYGLAAGIAFSFNALTSWYYAITAGLFLIIWALFRFRPLRRFLSQCQTWLALLLFVGAVLVLVLPAAWPYFAILRSADTTIPIENSNFFSASPTDYLIPSPFQFLWGKWVTATLLNRPAPFEFVIGVGLVSLLFTVYGWVNAPRRIIWPWLAVTLVAVVLSLGLTLHLAGRQVAIPAPAAVVAGTNQLYSTISRNYSLSSEPFSISREDGIVVPLPALFLRWFVPVLGKMRAWTRLGIITLLGVSMLASIGAAAWQQRELTTPGRRRIGWLIIGALLLFEFWWAPLPVTAPHTGGRPVDNWLASQPGHGAIIEYPIASGFDPVQLAYARVHGKPIVHAYTTYFPFVFSRRHPEVTFEFPGPEAIATLSRWQVQYVLINTGLPHTAEAETLLQAVMQTPCLHPRTVQDTVQVFELVDCPQ